MATGDKYDRQLRLWGALGQRLLMESNILLIGANGVGTETLKNLVLPGIGNFSILDERLVDESDLGSNFFTDSLGKPRAVVATELLCEMNPDVKGIAKVANFSMLLKNDPSYFSKFNLIITANLSQYELFPLAQLCWNASTPINLIALRSYGFIGSVRSQIRDHNIIESKADTDPFDLRISNPFPELREYCESYANILNNKTSVDSLIHSHIPYIVILYEAIKKWKIGHNNTIPSNIKESNQFKELIKELSINYNDEKNFQEAVEGSYRAYKRKELPEEVIATIYNIYENKNSLSSSSPDFYFLSCALVHFLEDNEYNPHKLQPLTGQVPDLTSSTELYIQLQKAYKDRSEADLNHFKKILNKILISTNKPENSISDEIIGLFCKNTCSLMSVTTRSFEEEIRSNIAIEKVKDYLENDLFDNDPVQTPLMWYLSLRAVDSFHRNNNRWPGEIDSSLESDQNEVFTELRSVCNDYDIVDMVLGDKNLITKAHAIELTRYGGSELHTISALIGGIAAQEAVKLITKQYVPLNNTYIFNGIASIGGSYEL